MNEYDTIPLYTAQARDEVIDPDFTSPDYGMAVPPYEEPVDPDFSVMPDTGVPCVFCNNHQWVHGAVRLLNAAAGYNPFTVLIDNQLAYTGLESPEITEYRQIPQGYHIFSVIDANQNTYFQKSMYVGDGMATIAIVNSAGGPEPAVHRRHCLPHHQYHLLFQGVQPGLLQRSHQRLSGKYLL